MRWHVVPMRRVRDDPVTMSIRVAIVQVPSVPFDVEASLVVARQQVQRAAEQGAILVVFGETWLTAYPAWIDWWPRLSRWDDAQVKQLHARFRRAAITVPGPHAETLAKLAAEYSVTLVVGINERVDVGPGHGTLYNSIVVFGHDGTLRLHHRKLVPTHTERLVWGPGDGHGLRAVDTAAGRLGGLVCWEHWMPLARQALHEQAEQIHVALWPTVKPMSLVASRHYAFEGRCFVLAAGSLLSAQALPSSLLEGVEPMPEDGWLLRGGSAVIAPDGAVVAGPADASAQLVVADLDLSQCDEEAMALDVTGHYARPDVLRFDLRRGPPRDGSGGG